MKTIIHDLTNQDIMNHLLNNKKENEVAVISDDNSIKHCIGCFGCWVKTPATCVIRDQYGDIGEQFSKSEEIIIISKCFYGGFSPFVKNVLDRSISYILPFFTIRNGEMHHKSRYKDAYNIKVFFYGDVTEDEKTTARKLIQANAINMNCKNYEITFMNNEGELEEIAL